MKQSVRVLCYCVGLTVLTSTVVIACGPFFPWQLLDNRKQTLLDLPSTDTFSQKIKNLGVVTAQEKQNLFSADNVNLLASEQTTCPNTDEAYKKAATLFHDKQWEEARSAFALLAYNDKNAAQQVCAKYTLGRIEKELGHFEDAVQSFNGTAYLVANGAPDPLHLGIAAYGEAAGVILDQIGKRITTPYNPKDDSGGITLWNVGGVKEDSLLQLQRAVELYLKQVKLGENSGLSSIVIILKGLSDPKNPDAKLLLDQAVHNPLLRKILLAYVLTDEIDYRTYSKEQTQNILQAFVKAGIDQKNHYDDLGSLGAFAYQNNDMDKAQIFAQYDWQKNQKALDAWVLAKIALRKGDKEKGQEYYHQAIAHFNDGSLGKDNIQRVQGERAVLTLSQGNFVQALEELWPVRDNYWGDVVYLAENVLTPDELKRFVNIHTTVPRDRQAVCDQEVSNENYYDQDTDKYYGYNLAGRSMALRHLLARRLMRAGRIQEAIPYFVTSADANCKGIPQHVQLERDYIKATTDMRRSFWATDRAKAAWKAAVILRRHGMALMGTSGYPDQNPGDYAYGISQMMGPVHNSNNKPWSVSTEQVRTGASWPIPNHRFHYRYLATQDVLYAASLIPHQSQAYAAILCHANGWMQDTSNYGSPPAIYYYPNSDSYESAEEHAQVSLWKNSSYANAKSVALYNLYLKNGPVVSFATHFGYNCPEPQFGAVTKVKRDLFWKKLRSSFHFLKGQ